MPVIVVIPAVMVVAVEVAVTEGAVAAIDAAIGSSLASLH
jgi:hypothetical protein